MPNLFKKIWYLLDARERLQLAGLAFMTLIGAGLELLGIGLVLPFISLIGNPNVIQESDALSWIYDFFGSSSPQQFLFWMGLCLLAVYWSKNLYLAVTACFTNRFIFEKRTNLSYQLLSSYLDSPYTFHLQRNTAQLLRNLTTEMNGVCMSVLTAVVALFADLTVVILLTLFLIIKEPIVSLIAAAVVGTAGVFFYRVFHNQLDRAGKIHQYHQGQLVQQINQALGGIKETKLLGRENFFLQSYRQHCTPLDKSRMVQQTLNQFPRLYAETVAITTLLLAVAVLLWLGSEIESILPAITLFALTAFRLIPSANRILVALNKIRFNSHSLDLIYHEFRELRDQQIERVALSSDSFQWHREITLDKVSFRYPNASNDAISKIHIKIPRGASVGFIGSSGAGKTTVVDIILGLLSPTEGRVLADGNDICDHLRDWQNQIGYIPQSIYLCDDTLRRNIALGIPDAEIDEEMVWLAVRSAQLEEFVATLPNGLDTVIGERGVRLSGGQRQRIGIARALYPNPQILVMDEATAALDNQTEASVMEAIASLSGEKTLIIIAHRLNTVKNCDRLYLLEAGKVIASGTYEELYQHSHEFQIMAGSASV